MLPVLEYPQTHAQTPAFGMRQRLRWGLLVLTLAMFLQPSHAQSVASAQANGQTVQTGVLHTTPSLGAASQKPKASSNPTHREALAPLMVLTDLPFSALPRSSLLRYRLSGMEKGIPYQASGELRWQRNASEYAMNLSLKVFLLGTKNWRSQGQITPAGLEPVHFTDIWRKERAVFFDRSAQRIVFDHHVSAAEMQMGAQDQVSLYAQLAAAMAHSGKSWPPGTRLQIQTATLRDALPWILSLEKVEALAVNGRAMPTTKWLAQRLHREDSQVEFWISAELDWLPVRIRISQIGGSFIDLQLSSREALPDLTTAPTKRSQSDKTPRSPA